MYYLFKKYPVNLSIYHNATKTDTFQDLMLACKATQLLQQSSEAPPRELVLRDGDRPLDRWVQGERNLPGVTYWQYGFLAHDGSMLDMPYRQGVAQWSARRPRQQTDLSAQCNEPAADLTEVGNHLVIQHRQNQCCSVVPTAILLGC